MSLKQDYKAILLSLDELERDTLGRLPVSKASLAVLISIDKHLKAIEGKL